MEERLNPEGSELWLVRAAVHMTSQMDRVFTTLSGEKFYSRAHGDVWDAARTLRERGEPVEPINLMRHLAAVAEDGKVTPGTKHVVHRDLLEAPKWDEPEHHAAVVAEFATFRDIYRAGMHVMQLAQDAVDGAELAEVLGKVHATFEELDTGSESLEAGPKSWGQLLREWEQRLDDENQRPEVHETPWPAVNDVFGGGLAGGRLYVFGGRPGEGKSTATFNITSHLAELRVPTLFFSAEMSDMEVMSRLVARGARISLTEIETFDLSQYSRHMLDTWRDRNRQAPVWVDSNRITLRRIKSVARRYVRRHGLRVLVVDYMQIVRTDQRFGSREQEVAHISRELKALARELDIAVAVPVQLNRGSGKEARKPTLTDLRESGQIEQDADVVVLLHHPVDEDSGERTGEVTFIVAKNRHGQTMDIPLDWVPGYATIRPWTPRGQE